VQVVLLPASAAAAHPLRCAAVRYAKVISPLCVLAHFHSRSLSFSHTLVLLPPLSTRLDYAHFSAPSRKYVVSISSIATRPNLSLPTSC